MDAEQAKQTYLLAGTSDELRAAFSAVRMATVGSDGEPKFSTLACHTLARSIVCRNYSKVLFQLCHLVNAAAAASKVRNDYTWLFFGSQNVNFSYFQASFAKISECGSWNRTGFVDFKDKIKVEYSDGNFEIPFSRMPLLAAMLEFIINWGFKEADEFFTKMLEHPGSQSSIKRASSELGKLLYNYLGNNLSSVQEQIKFSSILVYLDDRAKNHEVEISDDAVFGFWCKNCVPEEGSQGDFRTYRIVMESFIDFIRALNTGQTILAALNAIPVGGDTDADEVDLEDMGSLFGHDSEWTSPLNLFSDANKTLPKLLNKVEKEFLELLCTCGPIAEKLPFSILRSECFGKIQARISQAKRRQSALSLKNTASEETEKQRIQSLISCEDVETYNDRKRNYAKHLKRIRYILTGATYAVFHEQEGSNVINLNFPNLENAEDFKTLYSSAAYEKSREETRKVFLSISRKGFDKESLKDPNLLASMKARASALTVIKNLVQSYTEKLENFETETTNLCTLFQADKEVFQKQFARIYRI